MPENQSTTSPLGNRSKRRFSSDFSASPPNTNSRNPKRAPPARSPSHQSQPSPARSSSHHTEQSQPNLGQTLPQPSQIQNENWDNDQSVEHPQNLNAVSSVSSKTAIPDDRSANFFTQEPASSPSVPTTTDQSIENMIQNFDPIQYAMRHRKGDPYHSNPTLRKLQINAVDAQRQRHRRQQLMNKDRSSTVYIGTNSSINSQTCPLTSCKKQFLSKEQVAKHVLTEHMHLHITLLTEDQLRSLGIYTCPSCLQPQRDRTQHSKYCVGRKQLPDYEVSNTLLKITRGALSPLSVDTDYVGSLSSDLVYTDTIITLPFSATIRAAIVMAFNLTTNALHQELNAAAPNTKKIDCILKVLLRIPKWLLSKSNMKSLTTQTRTIRERLISFFNGDFETLEATSSSQFEHGLVASDPIKRASSLAMRGQFSRALAALDSSKLVDTTDPKFPEELQKLYPDDIEWTPTQSSTFQMTQFTESDINEAITFLKEGASPGTSGLRTDHLKQLQPFGIASSLTILTNAILGNKIPAETISNLFNMQCTPLLKSNGKIRPICVPETILKLISTRIHLTIKPKISSWLSPFQFGVGVANGKELMIHSISLQHTLMPDSESLILDITNAFGTVRRDSIRESLLQCKDGEILQYYFDKLYGKQTVIKTKDGITALSRMGVIQGETLSSLLFCISIDKILANVAHTYPQLSIRAYMDDIILTGDPTNLKHAYSLLQSQLNSVGLKLNDDKLIHYSQKEPKPSCINSQLTVNGAVILGTPIGTNEFIGNFLKDHTKKIEEILYQIASPAFTSIQAKLLLLRASVDNMSTHLARTISPRFFDTTADSINQKLLKFTLEMLKLPCDISDSVKKQISLPISCGGLSIGGPLTNPTACFVASITSVYQRLPDALRSQARLVFQHDLQTKYDQIVSQSKELLPRDPFSSPLMQHEILGYIHKFAFNDMITTFQTNSQLFDVQRLQSLKLQHSGAFLHAIPSSWRFALSNDQFKIAVRLRLGVPFDIPAHITCICGVPATNIHMQTCNRESSTTRHNAVRDILHNATKWARLQSSKEETLLTGDRLDLVVKFENSVHYYDVTVINTCQLRYLKTNASNYQPFTDAQETKMKHYRNVINNMPVSSKFIPLPFSTFGGFSNAAVDALKLLVNSGPMYPPPDANAYTRNPHVYFQHAIAASIQRENAISVMSRLDALRLNAPAF